MEALTYTCSEMGEVAANIYDVKRDGYSMSQALNAISGASGGDAQKATLLQGVAIAIYGDSSISSRRAAYNVAYSACQNTRGQVPTVAASKQQQKRQVTHGATAVPVKEKTKDTSALTQSVTARPNFSNEVEAKFYSFEEAFRGSGIGCFQKNPISKTPDELTTNLNYLAICIARTSACLTKSKDIWVNAQQPPDVEQFRICVAAS